MQIKLKSLLCAVSVLVNAVFAVLFCLAYLSPSESLAFRRPDEGFHAAAAVVCFPPGGSASFDSVEINIVTGDRASVQFSALPGKTQANLLINALFDPGIIAVTQTGYGVEITALSPGSTLMQTVANDGVKNIALINVFQE
jgi:hypothetical protein